MMDNSCIVLEGGGLRGAFTAGVLEYFLEKKLDFDRVIGVSAGACVGASYMSKQKGRNQRVNVDMPSDKRYMGMRHLLTTGSYFNMDFIFREIPEVLVPFDQQAFEQNKADFDIVATSLATGKPAIFGRKAIDEFGITNVLTASSSIPLMARAVTIGNKQFFDGGVADSIPAEYALTKHRKAVVVLTRPRGYRKEPMSASFIFRMAFRKKREFLNALLHRNEVYNQSLDFCFRMEKEGRLFILAPAPEFSISRTEQSREKRQNLFDHGYKLARDEFERLTDFLK